MGIVSCLLRISFGTNNRIHSEAYRSCSPCPVLEVPIAVSLLVRVRVLRPVSLLGTTVHYSTSTRSDTYELYRMRSWNVFGSEVFRKVSEKGPDFRVEIEELMQ